MSVTRAVKSFYDNKEKRGWDKGYFFFDIHGTILKPNYQYGNTPKDFYPYAEECLQYLSKINDITMVLYTCSHSHEIQEYIDLFAKSNIRFSFINENPDVKTEPNGYGYYDKKPYMNVLFEDKASFNPEIEWEEVLHFMMDYYENNNFNSLNKKYFEKFKNEHIIAGGLKPDAYAITELIKRAICNNNYKVYYGGGYEYKTENPIKQYDVIVNFDLAGDSCFMVALNCDEGDQCELYCCNGDKLIKKVF